MNNSIPIYQQVATELEKQVRLSMLPGDMLNSEHALAKDFGVNRHTLRRAVDQLIEAGMLVRKQGKGTQVLNNQIEYLLSSDGKFTQNLMDLGKQTQSVLLSSKAICAPDDMAVKLGLKKGDEVFHLTTLRFIESYPVFIIDHYLNPKYVPGILGIYEGGSLHATIAKHYQFSLQRDRIFISANSVESSQSTLLKCPLHTPLVVITSVNSVNDKGNGKSKRVVEVSISQSRPERMQFQIDFKDGKAQL